MTFTLPSDAELSARDLGFASASAFTTMFTRAVGEAPNEFRNRRGS